MKHEHLVEQLRESARTLKSDKDFDVILENIGEARCVMLGGSTHGTKEFYDWRTELTKRLIIEKGFTFIAVEGDWPECYVVNRYVKGYAGASIDAEEALRTFRRWPTWMWANEETRELVEWLHLHNVVLPHEQKVGFYGLDVYSLWESMQAVIKFLKTHDQALLKDAYKAFACFEPFGTEDQYARAVSVIPENCRGKVLDLLLKLRKNIPQYEGDLEEHLDAEQNAVIMQNAEHYYRIMMDADMRSWNVREQHMADTLVRLMRYHGPDSKVIVWAHNSHIGDVRATVASDRGMQSLGQLAREQFGKENVYIVGFDTYGGTVLAGSAWGTPMMRLELPQAREGSWEDLMNKAGLDDVLLISDEIRDCIDERMRDERAVGVVYDQAEGLRNYVPTTLTDRYDAFVFLNETQALNPMLIGKVEDAVPETYPSAV